MSYWLLASLRHPSNDDAGLVWGRRDLPSQSTLIGAAGEHYVLSELLLRGYIAALAPVGVPNADIVVTDTEGSRLCAIQVKTRRGVGADGGWHMKEKHEKMRGDRLFYCFVDFLESNGARPGVYVMPSTVVADAIRITHRQWLKNPGKKGHPSRDSAGRCAIDITVGDFVLKFPEYPAKVGDIETHPFLRVTNAQV